MRKLQLLLMMMLVFITCFGCDIQEDEITDEQEYKIEEKVKNTFVKKIQPRLRKIGFSDIKVVVTDIVRKRNIDYEYVYDFKVEFTSNNIDKYRGVKKNDKNAKKLFKALKNMNDIYVEYQSFRTSITWDGKKEEVCLDHNFGGSFTVLSQSHSYCYDFHSSFYQELLIDDKVMYENRPHSNSSSNKKPSSSNRDKAYMEGYYDVLENGNYDYERYYTDDDYRMGVDDGMLETGYSY